MSKLSRFPSINPQLKCKNKQVYLNNKQIDRMRDKDKIFIAIDKKLIIRLGELLGGRTIHSQKEIADLNFLLNNCALNKYGKPSKFGKIVFLVLPKDKDELEKQIIGKYHKEVNYLLSHRLIEIDLHPKRQNEFSNYTIQDQARFFNLLYLVPNENIDLHNSNSIGLSNFVVSCKRGIKFPEMKNRDFLSSNTNKQLTSLTQKNEKIIIN